MIVGRDDELRAITEVLDASRSGQSQVLVIRGEAGVGKSTLLRAATEQAGGMTLLSCAGVESEVQLAFSGLHQLLSGVLDHLDDLPAVQADAIRGALCLSGDQGNELLVSAGVLTLLATVAEERPLLVLVDDAQWLDQASTRALMFAFRRLLAEPIAVLVSLRDPSVLDTADLPELRLAGLSADAAGMLLADLGWQGSSSLTDALIALTAGNPLALTELVRDNDADRLADTVALAGTVPLSDRLHATFCQGVNDLSADAQRMLLVAAADESGDRHTVVGAARRLGTAPVALDEVERAHLVDAGLRFRHPLIRSAVYQGAASGARAAVHRALGEELTTAGQPERAAWHLALASTGHNEHLAAELERHAQAAGRRGGSAAVAAALQMAARLSKTPGDRTRRLAAAALAEAHAGQLPRALTLVDEALAEHPDQAAVTSLARLRGMIELDSGDPAVAYDQLSYAARHSPPDVPAEIATILFLCSDAAYHSNRMADATAAPQPLAVSAGGGLAQLAGWLADAADGRLPVSGTEPQQIAETAIGVFGPYDPRGAIWPTVVSWLGPHTRQARALGVEAGRRLRTAGMPGALAPLLSLLVDLDFHLGLWPAGLAHADEGLRFARQSGQLTRLADLLALRARLAAAKGDQIGCLQDTDQALIVALRQRNRVAAANATWATGLLALAQGDASTAYDRLIELCTAGGPYEHEQVLRAAIPDLVEAAVRAGRHDVAAAVLDRVTPWAERSTLPWAHAHLHRCRALISSGEPADEHYRLALSTVGEDRPFDHGRTALLYGEWLRRDRRPTAARAQLKLAVQTFDTLGATGFADRARAELRAAGGSAERTRTPAAACLTPQELQVAQLAAAGLSNREIGDQLFLSPRTVGYHLYKLFPKLSISHRSQLRDVDLGPT